MKKFVIVFLSFLVLVSCSKDDTTKPQNTTNEKQEVFQEFWDIYDKYYPLMFRKNINWQTVYDDNYSKITSSTTDAQLLDRFTTIMTTIIKDGHTNLTYNNTEEIAFSPISNAEVINMIENNTGSKLNIVPESADNPYISYGTLVSNPDIGYINSKNFEPIEGNENEFDNFKTIVDQALIALRSKAGIIIDVRTNGGGQSSFAYYLAGRFFSTNTAIEFVRKRIKTSTGSTESSLANWATENFAGYPDDRVDGGYVAGIDISGFTITASGTFQYKNKVAVLTSKKYSQFG